MLCVGDKFKFKGLDEVMHCVEVDGLDFTARVNGGSYCIQGCFSNIPDGEIVMLSDEEFKKSLDKFWEGRSDQEKRIE